MDLENLHHSSDFDELMTRDLSQTFRTVSAFQPPWKRMNQIYLIHKKKEIRHLSVVGQIHIYYQQRTLDEIVQLVVQSDINIKAVCWGRKIILTSVPLKMK